MRFKWGKNLKLLIVVTIFVTFLAGCWDSEELNTLAITGVIGIEKTNNKVNLIMEVYNPVASGGKDTQQGEAAKYIQSTGESFFDAIRNLTIVFDKKIFFAHTKEMIISEDTARNGFIDLLDLWGRQHQPWPNTYLLISKGTSPADIIGVKSGIETTSANYIEDLITNSSKNTGKTVITNVTDFLRYYYDNGSGAVGVISKKKKMGVPGEKNTEYELVTEGAAIFSGQKLVGFLNGTETRAMNFATGKIKSAIIVSPTLDNQGKNSVEVIRTERKINTYIEGNQILFTLDIKIMGTLAEETGRLDTDKNPEIIKTVANQNSEVVKKEVEDVIKKAQEEYKTDIFGFGQALHSKYPKQWKNMKSEWNYLFSLSEVRVTVGTDIENIGLLSSPVLTRR